MTDDPGQDRRRALIQLDWKIYADMEYWPLSDAIKLVLGVSPEACDDDRSLIRSIDIKMKRLISRVYYANPDWQQPSDDPPLDEKKLNEWLKSQGFDAVKTVAQWPVEVNDRGEVNAKQFIAWALEDGVEVPLGLIELVNPELATASLTRNNELHGVITRTYDGLKNKLNPNP